MYSMKQSNMCCCLCSPFLILSHCSPDVGVPIQVVAIPVQGDLRMNDRVREPLFVSFIPIVMVPLFRLHFHLLLLRLLQLLLLLVDSLRWRNVHEGTNGHVIQAQEWLQALDDAPHVRPRLWSLAQAFVSDRGCPLSTLGGIESVKAGIHDAA